MARQVQHAKRHDGVRQLQQEYAQRRRVSRLQGVLYFSNVLTFESLSSFRLHLLFLHLLLSLLRPPLPQLCKTRVCGDCFRGGGAEAKAKTMSFFGSGSGVADCPEGHGLKVPSLPGLFPSAPRATQRGLTRAGLQHAQRRHGVRPVQGPHAQGRPLPRLQALQDEALRGVLQPRGRVDLAPAPCPGSSAGTGSSVPSLRLHRLPARC